MLTQIINGCILTPTGWLHNATITFGDGKITDVGGPLLPAHTAMWFDAQGQMVVPGGIDMHCHGSRGHDFMEGTSEAFDQAILGHLQHGTTSIFPTLAASSYPMICDAIRVVEAKMKDPQSPILGLHLEGPYLNPRLAGGQMCEYLHTPDPTEYRQLLQMTHCIKRWDASPELPGAIDFARYASSHGVVVGIAHTDADMPIMQQAVEAGFTHATHFYNAMPVAHKCGIYKHEGTVECVYLFDQMTIEVIADGIHVPIPLLQLAHKIKGTERMALVSDALACTASSDGKAFDQRVIIEDGVCKLNDRSALAGSIATMDRLIRTMTTTVGLDVRDAIRMSSEVPARIMHVYDRKGSLEAGKDADIVIYNDQFKVQHVWQMGNAIN